jgi:hypothetical protein
MRRTKKSSADSAKSNLKSTTPFLPTSSQEQWLTNSYAYCNDFVQNNFWENNAMPGTTIRTLSVMIIMIAIMTHLDVPDFGSCSITIDSYVE